MNSYLFVNFVEIYNFKAKVSEINAAPLCLCNVSNNFSADNMKINQDYMDMRLTFQLIVILLM